MAKFQDRGCLQQFLRPLRIFHSRNLHQNLVRLFRLEDRFRDSIYINAVFQYLLHFFQLAGGKGYVFGRIFQMFRLRKAREHGGVNCLFHAVHVGLVLHTDGDAEAGFCDFYVSLADLAFRK